MDVLKNKKYESFDYQTRYANRPYYYHTQDQKEIWGLSSNLKTETTPWAGHKILPTDTLDSLALKYYNNPTLWWIIAFYNNIQDPFIKLSEHYTVLKIPNMSSLVWGDLR